MNQVAQDNSYDVIIVGAGMVGLTAALALVRENFKVAVLDRQESDPSDVFINAKELTPSDYDNRVSALTLASQRILDNLGVWERMRKSRVSPYTKMHVWDGLGSGEISFTSAELYQPCLGHIIENSVVINALLEAVKATAITFISGAQVEHMESLSHSRKLYCADGRDFEAKLVVGADGAMSKVRQLASLPMWQWDYGHHAIVATVRTEQSHQATAWQRFTDDGPLAFLPLDDDHCCSIVWSTSPAHAASLMALSEHDFCQQLGDAFEQRLGVIEAVDKRACFPLRQRHAMQYVQQHLAVIGDAAHTIHPLAGQGVNLGLLDAATLCETLVAAKVRSDDFASLAVLKKYQRLRQTDNLQMSAMMQGFKWLFDPQPTPVMLMRSIGMNLLNRATPLKQHIIQQAMGLSGDLPKMAQAK